MVHWADGSTVLPFEMDFKEVLKDFNSSELYVILQAIRQYPLGLRNLLKRRIRAVSG